MLSSEPQDVWVFVEVVVQMLPSVISLREASIKNIKKVVAPGEKRLQSNAHKH